METFGEMENYLQTVKEYDEVAVWQSAGTDIIHRLVLDTCVNVIGLFERRLKDLKFQRFCFGFVLHLEETEKAGYVLFTLTKP